MICLNKTFATSEAAQFLKVMPHTILRMNQQEAKHTDTPPKFYSINFKKSHAVFKIGGYRQRIKRRKRIKRRQRIKGRFFALGISVYPFTAIARANIVFNALMHIMSQVFQTQSKLLQLQSLHQLQI